MSDFASAFRAEAYRLVRNRNTWFWGFAFVPAVYLLFGLVLDLMMVRASSRLGGAPGPLWQATQSLAMGGNPLAHLFFASGAAALFGSEYRFATWRILCPRLPRSSLLLAKWAVYLLAAAAALAFLFLGSLAESAFVALLTPASASAPPVALSGLAIAFAGTFLELAALGSIVALATMASRSITAAIFIAFLLSFGQMLANAVLPPPSGIAPLLLMPATAGDAARRFALLAGGVTPVSAGAALVSIAILAGWAVAAIGLALAAFARQDLSRE